MKRTVVMAAVLAFAGIACQFDFAQDLVGYCAETGNCVCDGGAGTCCAPAGKPCPQEFEADGRQCCPGTACGEGNICR